MTKKFYFGCLTGLTVIAGLMAFGWHSLDSSLDLCEDVAMQEAVSPDARLKAIVYSRSCGVFTTGFTTQVALVREGEPIPQELGNVYVERSEYSQPKVSVQWEGNRRLLIKDDSAVIGRIASEAEKQVTVNLGWFRSVNVRVRYAELPFRQKPKGKVLTYPGTLPG